MAHHEINNKRKEVPAPHGDSDVVGALTSQIHAHEETLRKLKLARGSGTCSGQQDASLAGDTKPMDSSCSQSFLFGQLR